MNELVVLKAFDFYRKNKFYDKIGKLMNGYCENFLGTHEELIESLVQKFGSLLHRYDENERLLLQSTIEEQILKMRQNNENIVYSNVEIDFHIDYFNLIAHTIKKVGESEKTFFQVLKDRVERASDLLKNSKIQTNLQLLKADLNQKSQLYLETAGSNGEPMKQDKIKNVSQMNKNLKLKTINAYELYDVKEFCKFLSKLDSKGFFDKLEKDYSTKNEIEIYQNYQFITTEKHNANYIYNYHNPKSKFLAYFLEARSEEEYNEKVMCMVEKGDLSDRQRKMYERVLAQKQTLEQKVSLVDFRNDQSHTEKEKKKLWRRNYLHNMNEGVKMSLSDLLSPGSYFLREVFKASELCYWMLGEVNEVEAIYRTNDQELTYHFTIQNDSFSSFSRINYSIMEHAHYFFNEEDAEEFYHWLFDCIEIVTPKKIGDPEAKEDSNFFIQFLMYRLENNNISKEEFHYLFNTDSLKALSRGNKASEAVFKLLYYAMENFTIETEIDVFLKAMRQFDKKGVSVPIVERIYPEEFQFIRAILHDLISDGKYEEMNTAYLEFLK